MEDIILILITVPAVIIASTFHEFAHAWSAYQLGDTTSKQLGRLTLNPLKHIDIIGAISLVLLGFGWSKPVPVNPNNFEKPVIDNAVVAAAGPISNIILIALTAIITRVLSLFLPNEVFEFVLVLVVPFIRINAILAFFNLLPIPPLDGSRIIKVILPTEWQKTWESFDKYGFLILLGLLLLPFSPFPSFLSSFLGTAINFILQIAVGI